MKKTAAQIIYGTCDANSSVNEPRFGTNGHDRTEQFYIYINIRGSMTWTTHA